MRTTSPRSSPKRSQNSARRPRRTKAQIAADLALSGHVVGSKPSAAAVKRSRIAAKKRSESVATSSNHKRGTSDSPPFDLMDYKAIVAYLAKPNVLNALFGGGSQTKVTGLPMNPKTILNTLAIKINNNYNERHISTDMHLTGRTLLLRLRRYKAKYQSAKTFSSKTGAGFEAKHHSRGIHTMDVLLESMCPCYPEMDALFRDKGNVNPFGILDSGIGHQEPSEDESDCGFDDEGKKESDGDITDGHDRSGLSSGLLVPNALSSPARESAPAEKAVLGIESKSPLPVSPLIRPGSPDPLNKHYRKFLNNERTEFSSLPPTPKTRNDHIQVADVSKDLPPAPSGVSPSAVKKKRSKKETARKYALTAEEQAMDSSSGNDASLANTASASATKATGSHASRAPLSRRGLDPLPSIDPSNVHVKDHKFALASAIQKANDSKMEVISKAQEWRQQFDQARMQVDEARIQAELEDRKSTLNWTKERYFLDREEQREMESKRLLQEERKERKAFCEQLVLEGKTPQELEAYLRLIYPVEDKA